MTRPKVSVILYGYNYGRYLRQAVESVLNQTFQDFELIATDNGSSDDSPAILTSYAERDSRIRLMLHRNNILTGARWNEPFKIARGSFISLLNADDYYLPRKLELQIAEFERLDSDYGVVYSPGYRLNDLTGECWREESMHQSGMILKEMLLHIQDSGFINPISPLVRRECFDRYPFSGTNFFEGEGVYFRFGMSFKFGYLDEPLVVMRDHLFNLGKAIKVNQEVFLSMLGRLSEEADFPRDLIPALNTCIARKMASLGWQAIRVAEDVAWARECFALALSYDRWQILKPRVLVGAVLSALPASLLHRLNIAGSRLQKPRHNSVYRDLFELTRNRSNKV